MTFIRFCLGLVTIAFFIASCQTLHVIPPHNTPNLDNEHKLECVAGIGLSGLAGNFAYLPHKNLMVLVTGFTYLNFLQKGYYDNYADAEIGGSFKLGNRTQINVAAGYGLGAGNWKARQLPFYTFTEIKTLNYFTKAGFLHVFLNLKTDSVSNSYFGFSFKGGLFNDNFRAVEYYYGLTQRDFTKVVPFYDFYFNAQLKISNRLYMRGSTGVSLKIGSILPSETLTQNTNIGFVMQF